MSRAQGSPREAELIDPDHPMMSVVRLLKPNRARVLLSMLVFVVKDSPVWIMPVVTASVIDIVVAGGPTRSLVAWTIVGVVAVIQNYPGHVGYTRLFMGAVRGVGSHLRNELTGRLQLLSIGFHSRANSAIIHTKVVRDVENIELMLQQAHQPIFSATTVLIGALVMTAINVPAFLPIYALTIPLALMLRRTLQRRSAGTNEDFRKEVEHLSVRVSEMATLMPITRAHGLEGVARDRVATSAESVQRAGFKLDVLNSKFSALSWIAFQTLGFGCLVLAAWLAISKTVPITAGQVVLLSSYFALLTGSLTNILMVLPVIARGTESARSIAEVMQDPDLEKNDGKAQVESFDGNVSLRGVTFHYGDEGTAALRDIDLEIRAGETIALVGSSGSGKSTMLNLVLGFIRPTRGHVYLDGADMETLDLRTVRRFVSVVPQESVLFEGTVLDNVTYGLPDVSPQRVRDALVNANAAEFVDALPKGADTIVGERGALLSGGQRQRLSIARALIRDPRLLLLDEATSALDSESEVKIQDALQRLMRDRTTLVVAHRLSTIRSADRIVVMENGRIAEIGSHTELLSRDGRYRRLHHVQSA
ncbi:ABC transporter ATP-binding protein [Subtercola endophyticus]|uniref:ABC transporter ATP-binding protein n=1 Tax=Subtercola endophyticus TaxID=2895559 RepID=UPI001E655AD2|nr:ABC transporter ATP-binding protein [Subtercola endophyticus]UFS58723.1 ABC transporter ATP-binding protein/permease [Subtercola endophyticus]